MYRAKHDVFLCYSRVDRERVAALRDELKRRGYRVFFDVQSIDPGEKWKRRLERAIRGSRTLVLCWSESARTSDYCTFEYARAEALGRKVVPWLMDGTPLPAMLEINGITTADPMQAADHLTPALGWTLGRRRVLQMVALACFLAVAAAVTLWRWREQPPSWEYRGEVVEKGSIGLPISGVQVVLKEDGKTVASGVTDAEGQVDFWLREPKPKKILVELHHAGFERDETMRPTSSPFYVSLEPIGP